MDRAFSNTAMKFSGSVIWSAATFPTLIQLQAKYTVKWLIITQSWNKNHLIEPIGITCCSST